MLCRAEKGLAAQRRSTVPGSSAPSHHNSGVEASVALAGHVAAEGGQPDGVVAHALLVAVPCAPTRWHGQPSHRLHHYHLSGSPRSDLDGRLRFRGKTPELLESARRCALSYVCNTVRRAARQACARAALGLLQATTAWHSWSICSSRAARRPDRRYLHLGRALSLLGAGGGKDGMGWDGMGWSTMVWTMLLMWPSWQAVEAGRKRRHSYG
eukprot:scaffold877_cov362-Prasinococcus_capsulatus_cf.AAC.3